MPVFSFRTWLLPAIIILLSLLFAVAGIVGRLALRLDRSGIIDFELWRLFTGHLTHLGWAHFALNVVGLVLVWTLVGQYFSQKCWIAVLLATIAGIDLGLWFLDPELLWYVGLSGVLHGMLTAGVIAGLRDGSTEAAVLGLLLVCKLIWEQAAGPLPGSVELADGNVVVNAHLYGAISGGLAAAALIRVRSRRTI